MLVTPKAAEAAKIMLACLILCVVLAVSIWAYKLYAKRFLPPPNRVRQAQRLLPRFNIRSRPEWSRNEQG